MHDVTKSFPGVQALKGVSLTVREGEVHALLGENGAGKSTLMNVLAGVFPHYGGQIMVAGEPASIHHPRDAGRLGIGMIHQELNLVPELSIADNIFLGSELRTARGTINRPAMNARTRELLGALGIELDPRRLIRQCRVAEQQLVEVAKALNLNVRIFVMDEPTSALADAEVQRLFTVIRQLVSRGVAVVFISHRLEELYEIADNVTVLRDGGLVGTCPVKDISREDLIQMMVGRPFSEFATRGERADSSAGPPSEKQADRLSVTGLHVDRGNRPPLRDVSFAVRPGEIVGLAGLMGAGRTEVLEAVYGAYSRAAVRGTFLLDGKPYRPRSPGRAIRRGLAFVAEDRKTQSLMLEATVRFNASLAALRGFVRGGVVRGRQERAAVEAKVRELQVRTPSVNAVVNNLSGGNQQKVVLARCLLTRPSLLLMDEPTRGVDVGAKTEIYQIMNKLAAGGCGILMVSSELPELLALCDRILVLCEGRLTGEFRSSQATQEKILAAAMARESVIGKAPSDEDHQPSEA
jgi:ABC-type sugar transport system ATPase subunit